MDVESVQFVLYGITAAGGILWISALMFLVSSSSRNQPGPETDTTYGLSELEDRNTSVVKGEAEVEGDADDLAEKALKLIAQGKAGIPARIVSHEDRRITFEASAMENFFRRGCITFAPAGSLRTRVAYSLQRGRSWLMTGAWLSQGLGLIALVVGFWLVQTYIVNNGNPAVRQQVFQMFQTVHFLWPPFLFAGLQRKQDRMARQFGDTLISNLPYLE